MAIATKTRKDELKAALEETRSRTLRLLDYVSDDFLRTRVHEFYSPVGWHFGHVGRTEEFWVVHKALAQSCLDDHLSFMFADLPENPKDNRVNIPSREQIKQYLSETRKRCFDALEVADIGSESPFLRDGYVWEFAIQHECQHQETICEMLQLIHMRRGSAPEGCASEWKTKIGADTVEIPSGAFLMGTDALHAYDNERDEHEVTVAAFRLDRTPVTAFQWTQFMADGGYSRREFWTAEGWAWREKENVCAPEYWLGNGFYYGPMGPRAMHPDEPVSCISWYEADAYARWAGKRLPTEEEWEYAARRGGGICPWGSDPPEERHAVHNTACWGPMPVGSKPEGASTDGVLDMAGNVWEWTSSPFLPYPGFRAFPYDGYSKDHMGGHHFVCRGGSWATSKMLLRSSFRNWYVPTYRQGFLGFRCAEL